MGTAVAVVVDLIKTIGIDFVVSVMMVAVDADYFAADDPIVVVLNSGIIMSTVVDKSTWLFPTMQRRCNITRRTVKLPLRREGRKM
jgi:hypothetical protein